MKGRISALEQELRAHDFASAAQSPQHFDFDAVAAHPDDFRTDGGQPPSDPLRSGRGLGNSLQSSFNRTICFGGLFLAVPPLVVSPFVETDAARVQELFHEWQQSSGVRRSV